MTVFALTIAYVVIVIFLLLVSLQTPYRWQYKVAIILLCSLFYGVSWHALPKLQGWPIDDQLPVEFQLVAKYIVQPNKKQDTDGAIYMWVIDLENTADRIPRAYELPYQKALHKNLLDAAKSGKAQKGKRVEQSGSGGEGEGSTTIQFEDIKRVRPPTKN